MLNSLLKSGCMSLTQGHRGASQNVIFRAVDQQWTCWNTNLADFPLMLRALYFKYHDQVYRAALALVFSSAWAKPSPLSITPQWCLLSLSALEPPGSSSKKTEIFLHSWPGQCCPAPVVDAGSSCLFLFSWNKMQTQTASCSWHPDFPGRSQCCVWRGILQFYSSLHQAVLSANN